MITKLRRQMIFMVMGVVTVLLMAIFLILYHSAVSGFDTRSVEALREALQQEQPHLDRHLLLVLLALWPLEQQSY